MTLVAAAIAAAIALGAGGSTVGGAITSNKAAIRRQLAAHLHRLSLRPLRIACVKNGRDYDGVPVIRCNIDYGEPHIVAVCSVLRGGRLLTDHAEPAIPCGHDNAGWHSPIETFR